MPKNMGKGGKSFKAGNSKSNQHNQKRELILASPEEGEEYGQVKKALGSLRLEIQLAGGATVIGQIRGAMVRKVWITPQDVVIIAKRDFNANDIVDVIYKYTPAEVRELIKAEEIPRDFRGTDETTEASKYIFVADEEEEDKKDKDKTTVNRDEVVLLDPLGELDDL